MPAIEAEAVVTYVGGHYPTAHLLSVSSGVTVVAWPNGILFGVGLMLIFFVLNFLGIRFLSEVNRWTVWWKLVIPTVTFLFLFAAFRGVNLGGYTGGFTPFGPASIFGATASTGIIFSHLGFRQALDFGGEARNPQRDIPLATILSVVIGMVVYTLIQVVFLGALRWHSAGVHPGDWAALTGSVWASGPLYHALQAAGIGALGAFGTVLLIDAGVSPSGTGWIYLGTAQRTNYGLSVDGYIPRAFQWMNRFRVPWISLIAALVVGCVFFIPAPSWYKLVGFITSCTVLTYVMGGVGLPVLRKHCPDLARPFRLRNARFWSPVGYLAAIMIVYWSGFATLTNVFAAVFVGLPLFTWFYAWKRGWMSRQVGAVLGALFLVVWILINHAGGWVLTATGAQVAGAWSFPLYDITFSAAVVAMCAAIWLLSNAEGREHVQRSLWLILLILVTFPLSYDGGFGPLPVSQQPLHFPVGTLLESVVALVIYDAAVASGFASEELQSIIRSGRGVIAPDPEEGPLADRVPGPGRRLAGRRDPERSPQRARAGPTTADAAPYIRAVGRGRAEIDHPLAATGWRRLLVEPRRPPGVAARPNAHWLVVATVCVGAFMGQLDASIVLVAVPNLQRAFLSSLPAVEWVSITYLLVLVAMVTAIGRFADMAGRKLLYIYGFLVFILGSALCGLAPTLLLLDLFRVLQAVGAAMLQANSVALIVQAMPDRELGRGIGVQGAAQALGLAMGPSVGGALIALGSWRLIFFVNVPVGIVGTALGWYLLPRSRDLTARVRFDWLGLGLFVPAVAGLMYALSFGDQVGWVSAPILATLAGAALLGAGFVIRERRIPSPMVDLALFARTQFTAGIASGLLSYLVLFGVLFVAPIYLEFAHHLDSQAAGLLLTPMPLALGVAAPVAGRLAERVGARPLTVGGMLCAALGLFLVALTPDTGARLIAELALTGIGLGAFTAPNNAAIMGSAPKTASGVASGLLNMTRGMGTTMGVAFTGLVFGLAAGASTARADHPAAAAHGFGAAIVFLAAMALAAAALAALRGDARLSAGPVAVDG